MRAGGVAHEEGAAGIDAEPVGIVLRPAHGPRGVLHEPGKTHLRIKPVVGNDNRQASPRQHLRDEAVLRLRSAAPAPAVEENDGRAPCIGGARAVDVETMPRGGPVGDVGLAAVIALGRHGIQQTGRRASRERAGQRQDKTGQAPPTPPADTRHVHDRHTFSAVRRISAGLVRRRALGYSIALLILLFSGRSPPWTLPAPGRCPPRSTTR